MGEQIWLVIKLPGKPEWEREQGSAALLFMDK